MNLYVALAVYLGVVGIILLMLKASTRRDVERSKRERYYHQKGKHETNIVSIGDRTTPLSPNDD